MDKWISRLPALAGEGRGERAGPPPAPADRVVPWVSLVLDASRRREGREPTSGWPAHRKRLVVCCRGHRHRRPPPPPGTARQPAGVTAPEAPAGRVGLQRQRPRPCQTPATVSTGIGCRRRLFVLGVSQEHRRLRAGAGRPGSALPAVAGRPAGAAFLHIEAQRRDPWLLPAGVRRGWERLRSMSGGPPGSRQPAAVVGMGPYRQDAASSEAVIAAGAEGQIAADHRHRAAVVDKRHDRRL